MSGRDGTRGRGFGENPPAGKPAVLGKIRPQADPRVHFCAHTRTCEFRMPADVAIDIIKMHKFINLNSQTINFYK